MKKRLHVNQHHNVDSTQAIMANTVIDNGKWQFWDGDRLVAETDAPEVVKAAVIEDWCEAVRVRATRPDPSIANKKANRARKESGIGNDNGPSDGAGSATDSSTEDDDTGQRGTASTGSFEEEPFEYAKFAAEQLTKQIDKLEDELHHLNTKRNRWIRIANIDTEDNNNGI